MRFVDLADQGKPNILSTSALGVSAQPIEGLKNEKALALGNAWTVITDLDGRLIIRPLHRDLNGRITAIAASFSRRLRNRRVVGEFDHLPGVLLFELGRAPVSERGMEPPNSVHWLGCTPDPGQLFGAD